MIRHILAVLTGALIIAIPIALAYFSPLAFVIAYIVIVGSIMSYALGKLIICEIEERINKYEKNNGQKKII